MSLQEECSTKLNPAGTFVDDYEYIRNAGTLDEHNGRYCVTPNIPNGTPCLFSHPRRQYKCTYVPYFW